MTKDEEEDRDKLRPIKKARVALKRTPSFSYRHHHYQFLKSDNAEPAGVLDPETDEWLYRLFKPTPDWER
mgnify:CR=1 FL=1|jgi:hypothetical protein|tara:strand:- start:96 stop:305 length:210 start_codon:yes stop_codon:yes gene_type:complete